MDAEYRASVLAVLTLIGGVAVLALVLWLIIATEGAALLLVALVFFGSVVLVAVVGMLRELYFILAEYFYYRLDD